MNNIILQKENKKLKSTAPEAVHITAQQRQSCSEEEEIEKMSVAPKEEGANEFFYLFMVWIFV